MSSVKHNKIHMQIISDQDEAGFLADLDKVLGDVRWAANNVGATVDWSTLTIEPAQEIEVRDVGGRTQVYREPLTLSVDTVWIEEG